MAKIPVILFNYLLPHHLDGVIPVYKNVPRDILIHILSTQSLYYRDDPPSLSDSLITNLGRILKSDMEKEGYNTIYPSDDIRNIIITDDIDDIIRSITECIIFVMDKVLKTDIIDIQFKIDHNSDYPSIIYSALQQNFKIKHYRKDTNLVSIIIERSNTNGNGN